MAITELPERVTAQVASLPSRTNSGSVHEVGTVPAPDLATNDVAFQMLSSPGDDGYVADQLVGAVKLPAPLVPIVTVTLVGSVGGVCCDALAEKVVVL